MNWRTRLRWYPVVEMALCLDYICTKFLILALICQKVMEFDVFFFPQLGTLVLQWYFLGERKKLCFQKFFRNERTQFAKADLACISYILFYFCFFFEFNSVRVNHFNQKKIYEDIVGRIENLENNLAQLVNPEKLSMNFIE